MTAFNVPPVTTAGRALPLAAAEGDALEVPELPHAARSEPTALAERPKTEARTSSWRLVILPLMTCSTRWFSYSLRYCWSSMFGTPPRLCLLYTSDAADEEDSVDLGGRRIIKKK